MRNIFWPSTDTPDEAKRACQTAAVTAFFVTIVTAVVSYLISSGKIKSVGGIDSSAYIDAGIFLLLGVFLLFCSRIAALIALLLYVAERVYMMKSTGGGFNFLVIVFTLNFVNGVRGAFAYHSMKADAKREEQAGTQESHPAESEEKPARPFPWKTIFLVLVLAALGAGVWLNKDKLFSTAKPGPAAPGRRISKPALPVKMPSLGGKKMTFAPEERGGPHVTLTLKNGKTVSGEIVYEDETYYTLNTSGGQEFVIKEDVASKSGG